MRFLTHELPGTGGVLKQEPEDFRVEEVPLEAPTGEGAHLFLRVEKRGMTTHEAVLRLAHGLRISERDIGYAGIKDARAVVLQWFSVPAFCEPRLAQFTAPWIRIHAAIHHHSKLRVGCLAGNRFEILLREVDETAVSKAQAILDVLARRGVPNWFGAQRFGTKGDGDEIGKALVRQDCDEALRWFLGRPSPRENDPRIRAARQLFDEGRLEEAERTFPPRLRLEASVLRHFRLHGNAVTALMRIPRRLRLLFLSAYQSRLFNRCLEARFATLDRLVEGDVAVKHADGAVFLVADPMREQPRVESFEISPAGPIFGPGLPLARAEASRLEREVFDREGLDPTEGTQAFRDLHLRGERRPYRFPIEEAGVAAHPDGILLRFTLPRGCYATNVVAEVTKHPDEAESAAGPAPAEGSADAEAGAEPGSEPGA